jgi:hypothetical protein
MFIDGEIVQAELLPLLDKGRTAVLVSHSLGCVAALAAVRHQTVDERSARGLKGGIKCLHLMQLAILFQHTLWGLT